MNTQSESTSDRSAGPAGPILLVLLLVVGLVLGGMISYFVWGIDGGDVASSEDECERYRTVELAVAPEMYAPVTEALDEVEPECVRVRTSSLQGGDVALGVSQGGAPPDVWIPEARFWTTPTFLDSTDRVRVVSPSLARTPVLLVGGPSAQRYASWGEAESSGFVSVPDPLTTTVGALAVVAPQAEARATGRSVAAAKETVVPFAQKYGERKSRGFDDGVSPSMLKPRSPRLVVTTEQEFARADEFSTTLQDLTPAVGAPTMDFPLTVRRGAASGSRMVAHRLMRYLEGDAGRALLEEAGLRQPTGPAPEDAVSEISTYLPTPPAPDIAATVLSWRTLSVPSAILAVVDASGSMDFAAEGGTRMSLLADAASIGLSFLPGHARVGLWIFSIDKGGPGQDWQVLEPMRRLDHLEFGRTQRFALRSRIGELPGFTDGGTGLYDTALAAYRQALRDFSPDYSNAVVLMTDGENEDPGSIELPALLRQLRALRDPERPVRIVGIAISQDADLGALQRMARVTGGQAYLAEQPEDILGVFAQAVLSR